VTTTRQGWRSSLDLRALVFTVIVCGSVPLLAFSSAWSLARAASPSRGGSLRHSSGLPPSNLPGDNNDIDDNDDDDGDGDEASALPGRAFRLTADPGPVRLLGETQVGSRGSLRWGTCLLRGPPCHNLDEHTRSLHRHSSNPIAVPPALDAAGSHRHSQTPSHDPQEADDRDLDDRDDDDDDDDDDGDDERADALPAASAVLTTAAHDRRLIHATFGAHSPVRSEAHSLRGPPRILTDHTPSFRHGIPHHTPPFSLAPHGPWLRAPPDSLAPTNPAARARTSIATASRRT
jgi:hypothetical protein